MGFIDDLQQESRNYQRDSVQISSLVGNVGYLMGG